jgi:hypothetical protein
LISSPYQSIIHSVSLSSNEDQALFEALGDFVKLDPIKLGTSDYAKGKIALKLDDLLKLKPTDGSYTAWKLYRKMIDPGTIIRTPFDLLL